MTKERVYEIVDKITDALGSVTAITIAVLVVVLWAVSGPFLDFSETWQLIINTATTITTGLMVFVIQNTQNRDSRAMHTKLDALIEALDDPDDNLVGLESSPSDEIKRVQEDVEAQAESSSDNESIP